MSIWVLIISFIVLYFSLRSMKNLLQSSKQLQEKFLLEYEKGVKASGEQAFYIAYLLFAIFYTVIWVGFYVIVFNVFNSGELILSLVAVFFLLQTIYNFFKGLIMLSKKEVRTSLLNKLLNTIELVYVVYFIYYYITSKI